MYRFMGEDLDEICTCGHRNGDHFINSPNRCSEKLCVCSSYQPEVPKPSASIIVDDDFDRLFVAREE